MATLYKLDFVGGKRVQVIDKSVDLRVRGGDLAFQIGFPLRCFGDGNLLVQLLHLFDELYHLIVTGFVGFIGKVNDTDGKASGIFYQVF